MEQQDLLRLKEEVALQEKTLRFESFNSATAWDLGCFMVERVRKMGIDLAISIRKLNGNIVFQHVTDGTAMGNQLWMDRKFRTVAALEMSSYAAWVNSQLNGMGAADHGLNERECVFCGGAFPIRLKGGELVGAVIVSNLPHEQDHQFVVDSLTEWLKK